MLKTIRNLTAVAALSLASASAFANLPFQVNPNSDPTPGAGVAPSFEADSMKGNYQEAVLYNAADQTFQATIYVQLSDFFNGGAALFDGFTGLGDAYGLYAVLEVTGNVVADMTGITALTGFSGDINVFADWSDDTAVNPTTRGPVYSVNDNGTPLDATDDFIEYSLTNTGDDVLLASAATLSGGTNIGATSSFGLASDAFELTGLNGPGAGDDTDGAAFFTAPRPFYMELTSSGNLTSFFDQINASAFLSGELFTFGDGATISFVAEPSSVALIGLSIFGLALYGRKKS